MSTARSNDTPSDLFSVKTGFVLGSLSSNLTSGQFLYRGDTRSYSASLIDLLVLSASSTTEI